MIKKKTHKNLYKHVKKMFKKILNSIKLFFIIQYRNKQRLHVKKN